MNAKPTQNQHTAPARVEPQQCEFWEHSALVAAAMPSTTPVFGNIPATINESLGSSRPQETSKRKKRVRPRLKSGAQPTPGQSKAKLTGFREQPAGPHVRFAFELPARLKDKLRRGAELHDRSMRDMLCGLIQRAARENKWDDLA